MALVSNFLTLILTFGFFFGQLGKIDIYQYSASYLDISIAIIFIANLTIRLIHKDLKIKNQPFTIFLIISWVLFFYHATTSHFYLTSILYLLRLTVLLSFFILPPTFIHIKLFNLGIISNLVFGLIQYYFWPDFTAFKSLNWDPHLYRLVSTYFDPTFTALIYLIFIIYLFCSIHKSYFLLLVSYVALSLTYSRSSFLSLIVVGFVASRYLKKPLLGPLVTALVVITILVLPRFPGEGTKLERDSSIRAKIVNYQEGIKLFNQHPFTGVGYNNLPQIRQNTQAKSHALSGFDSSLLTILTTTGLLGIVPFTLGLYQLFKTSTQTRKLTIIAVLVHSLFANSLLYPWILVYLALI